MSKIFINQNTNLMKKKKKTVHLILYFNHKGFKSFYIFKNGHSKSLELVLYL